MTFYSVLNMAEKKGATSLPVCVKFEGQSDYVNYVSIVELLQGISRQVTDKNLFSILMRGDFLLLSQELYLDEALEYAIRYADSEFSLKTYAGHTKGIEGTIPQILGKMTTEDIQLLKNGVHKLVVKEDI